MSNTMSISSDKKSIMPVEKQQSYDMAIAQALSLLKENPSEQRLDIRLPYAEYLKLDQCWSKEKSEAHISEDQRYPYLAYNSAIETASVVTVPNQVHEVAAKEMCREIMNSIETYLAVNPPAVGEIQDIGSTTIKGSHGRYNRILKQADGLFKFRGKGFGTRLMVAIEVGFSEMYHALCHDKDLWIDGNHVKICILVRLRESPPFRNPSTPYNNVEDVEAETDKMDMHVDEIFSPEHCSPISYWNHKWLGEMKEAVIEVWRADRTHPDIYPVIQDGKSSNSLPTTIGLTIRDFFPDNAWDAVTIPDGNLPFRGTVFLQNLKQAMIGIAVARFHDFISK